MGKSKLLTELRTEIRRVRYSYRTEQSYTRWVNRFVFFHNLRHPEKRGGVDVVELLNSLDTERYVAVSTQNQALCANLFIQTCF
ncbi:MAG: hypothetical protein GVY07_04375 [Bacteroidetes bacterium]|nr:hypothetical protein [Bacteroidota bacterium]